MEFDMKKKISKPKRQVKKKIVKRKKKISSPEQWGKAFEKLARRPPMKFNFIHPSGGINGDPFCGHGVPDANHDHALDAMRYYSHIPDKPVSLKATRGELGAAPAHYSHGKITPWEVIDDWDLDYYCGNATKYVCRHKHKGKPVEDIQKAIDCLIKYKQKLEKETK